MTLATAPVPRPCNRFIYAAAADATAQTTNIGGEQPSVTAIVAQPLDLDILLPEADGTCLPVASGVANVDRSIALETAKIAASASGTLDFRNETLDLSVKPQIREGIKVDVSQLAGLVRIRGPFAKPAVAIDAAQTAQMIAKLGILGAQGGGIEALGRALIAPAGEASSPCAIAQSGKVPREATAAPRDRQAAPDASLPKDVGREVGKAHGKLFGR